MLLSFDKVCSGAELSRKEAYDALALTVTRERMR